ISLSRVGSASVLGLRKQNEDRLRIARIHDNLLYFAVFDGHGGPHAADYCCTFMEKCIRLNELQLTLKDGILTTMFYKYRIALLQGGIELVVGSVGDSRAMLIQRFGGFLSWNSVGQANVNGRLAMTRSIGDFHLKSSGVIAEPETHRLSVQHANDSFLALTTDGINFLLSDQEICDVINQCQDPTEAAEVISQQALQYGSEDNATIVIIPFGAWGKHKSSTTSYSMSRNFASSGRWA
ncbi:hypothetical protein XENOCAPTIV_012997, partial [Xenoophorus captivus]